MEAALDSATLEELVGAVLPLLTRALRSDCIGLNVGDGSGFGVYLYPEGLWTGDQLTYLANIVYEHPLVRYFSLAGQLGVRSLADVVDEGDFAKSRLFQDVYRPMGVRHQLAISLSHPHSGQVLVGLAIHRSSHSFSHEDIEVAEVVRAMLVRAWESLVLGRLLDAALDVAQDGSRVRALVDDDYVVRCVSPTALAAFADAGCRLVLNQTLSGALRHFVADARFGTLPGWLPVKLSGCKLSEELRLSSGPFGFGGSILTLAEESPELRHTSRLTRRQLEVLALVEKGHTNSEIARSLGIRGLTVKKHLENIYDRLDVQSRTAAVHVIRLALSHAEQGDAWRQ